MAFAWNTIGKTSDVLAAVQAVDPATLQDDADRALRTALLTVLPLLPAGSGVQVHVVNDDATHWAVEIARQAILNFAS